MDHVKKYIKYKVKKKPKKKYRRKRLGPDAFLSDNQKETLLSVIYNAYREAKVDGRRMAHIRDYYIISLLLLTGLRRSELCNLKIQDVEIREMRLTVVNGKGGKGRVIPLTPGAINLILNLLDDKQNILKEPVDPNKPLLLSGHMRPYHPDTIYKRIKFWFKKAGFPKHLSPHNLRHTHACIMLESKQISLVELRDLLGHSRISTTDDYLHARRNGLPDININKGYMDDTTNKRKKRKA